MPSSSGSQPPSWSDFTDSSISKSGNPRSWSNLTDSDESDQVHSWSTSDWSPCPAWSLSRNSSNHQQENWDAASSSPSKKSDKDYNPGSTFNPLVTAQKPQSESEASDYITQPTQPIAMHLANSVLWIAAYHGLEALKPGEIVTLAILDFFLSWESLQSRHCGNSAGCFYYLHNETVQKLSGDPDHDRSLLKKCFGFSNQHINYAPVMFLVSLTQNTYFLVLFDFSENKALILGRYSQRKLDFISSHAEWRSWHGPTLWNRIGRAFNWLTSEMIEGQPEVVVYEANWIPDSHSGPGISTFSKLLRDGNWSWEMVSFHRQKLNFDCDHKAREEMFYTVLHASHACFALWKKMSRGNKDWIQPPDDSTDEMHIPPAQYQWVRNLSLIFLNQRSRCNKCHLDANPDDLDMDNTKGPSSYLKGRDIHPPTTKTRTLHLPHPLPIADTESNQESDEGIDYGEFDDYSSARIWSGDAPPLFDVWTFDSLGIQILPNFASTWKDRGYRLPPDFAMVSGRKNPTDFISRILPTMDINTQKSAKPDTAPPSAIETPENIQNHPTGTNIRDPISMGAKGMLDEAGRIPKTRESYDVFVRGKTRTGDFLQLDLEQDHVSLTRDQVSISIDIDSVLWITTKSLFSCKGAVNLHLLPHFADKPPFSANPSVYITLLGPPENKRQLNNPQLRRKARYPLSSIPHMPFGYFGEASQQFNLYIFFPRMIHKNTNNNRTITIMPQELQDLWFSEVMLKALASALNQYPGIGEYLPHSTEHLRWKTGDRARRPTIPLAPESLASLLTAIHYGVSENDDLLSCFGSFFFVLDARGIKLLSKQYKQGETAFQALQGVVPGLDWDYMQDRANGELYLDLGVSFHPTATTEPMVGLWRLESLRSSYALMGKSSTNSKDYHFNTMRDFGGLKAETSHHVLHNTHIVKRISYNLHFECVRQPGQQSYISSLDDAILCNQKYLDGCTRWTKALEAGAKHSYGVRDELRASGFVVLELLKVVLEGVRDPLVFCFMSSLSSIQAERFLKSNPIIWIPATTFFTFALRRFTELQDIHQKLAATRPQNYGTLTALIFHLMRSVMVNPYDIPSYVQSALKMLHQRAVMAKFGMFFIDDLDPYDMERIYVNLGQKDGSEIGRKHKRALATMQAPKKAKDKGIQLIASRISTEYPWGETISMSMLQTLCKQHPVDFLRRFDFENVDIGQSSPEIFKITEDLFISFTKDAWLCFQESFLPAGIRPTPSNLQEAMEIWSCQKILALLGGKSTFFPSTYLLEGVPMAKKKNYDVSFQELRSLFFPLKNKQFKTNAIWEGLMEPRGYIGRYWEIFEEKKDVPDIIDAIHESLDEIFSQVQCLPQSTADSIWHAKDGSVCFLTNPFYYRVKSINSSERQTKLGPQRPQVSTAELRKRLNPGTTIPRKRKRKSTKMPSSKSRNYRPPPAKKQRVMGNSFRNENDSHSSSSKLDADPMDTDSDGITSDSSF